MRPLENSGATDMKGMKPFLNHWDNNPENYMARGGGFTVAEMELLSAAPSFVTRVERIKSISLGDLKRGDSTSQMQRIYIPNPIYPSDFISNLPSRAEHRKKRSPSRASHQILGFKNPSQVCHLNAIISTIINLKFVYNAHDRLHTNCTIAKNCGMCAFVRLFTKTVAQSGGHPVALASTSFGKLFSKIIDLEASNDAGNDLIHLLKFLRQEEIRSHSNSSKRHHSKFASQTRATQYDIDDELLSVTSAVGRYFSFVVCQTEECAKCSSPSTQRLDVLWSLPIYPTENETSLNALVNVKFNDSEFLGESCKHCGEERYIEYLTMESIPAYLIVRVLAHGRLNSRPEINHSEIINLSPDARFRVAGAVCVQRSTPAHYYAVVKTANGWFHIDDDNVEAISENRAQEQLSFDSYLLFCENIGKIVTCDQQVVPLALKTYEQTDCPLVETCRVLDEKSQLATGLGLDHSVKLELVVQSDNTSGG